ncbi:MAG TPA: DUF2309 domain-containing protein [Nitrospiraceae bacterium]|nr:DUF2309 domain-containing protein [Nitrospiraceae bacterium]
MEQVTPTFDLETLETRRMELRGIVRLAGEVIGRYWPMRTFVHHNPFHSLEYLHFDETVRRGRRFLGGQGYLSGETYRGYLRSGRILLRHVDEALRPLVREDSIIVGPCRIAHREVLRACLTHGLCAAADEPFDALLDQRSTEELIATLADHLSPVLRAPTMEHLIATAVREDTEALGRYINLSNWCDCTLGTQIVTRVNNELIKWCEAFLDEGHATWPMPGRKQGFYAAWKSLAAREWSPCGIKESRRKITELPEHPEDAVLESLAILGVPNDLRQDYLALQLTALPGWAGFIKWRAEQQNYAWQQAYPISLVKFLAVRLWYVRELVQQTCHEELGIKGDFVSISAYMQDHPHAYCLRKEQVAGRLPAAYAEQVERLSRNRGHGWKALADRVHLDTGPQRDRSLRLAAARRLVRLAQALDIVPTVLLDGGPNDLATLVSWMEAFPESDHGPVWLKSFEAGYQEQLLGMLMRTASTGTTARPNSSPSVRPDSQSVFCIDVRSGPFRRHLESTGDNETYGFGGFFAALIRYRAWGKEHDTEQFPVIMRARNEVREVPRSYLDHMVLKHTSRTKLLHAGHTLLHDLKENVITQYVMVESLGWFYGLPIVGKTAWPRLYRRFTGLIQRLFVPPIATSLTVDKLSPIDIQEMLVAEQRAAIRKALRDELGVRGSRISADFIEALRRYALNGQGDMEVSLMSAAQELALSAGDLTVFVGTLRSRYRIDQRSISWRKERITRAGFTLDEQVVTVETALRMMGLVRNFARIVLFCAHGSTSENNPFESALDCGACGGNEGKPNARVLAMIANNQKVRERLAKSGIEIPSDTHFLAGQVDTTTDDVHLFDLEDVPPTHRKDVARLLDDLREAGQLTSQERCSRFPEVKETSPLAHAQAYVRERSADWSQVRPEWGLAGNASFIIGRRELTKGLNLAGRAFQHSYDYREDPTNRLLEVLMTAPQVVAQWINMEHYFSAVDNEVYGGGSKVYHNVVGRIGIISGPWSDLRLGLARQTVMNGETPYHEPMRMLTVIEAPRANIGKLIGRHEVLQHLYHNEWVHLVAVDPEDGGLYRYRPTGAWSRIYGVREYLVNGKGKESVE